MVERPARDCASDRQEEELALGWQLASLAYQLIDDVIRQLGDVLALPVARASGGLIAADVELEVARRTDVVGDER